VSIQVAERVIQSGRNHSDAIDAINAALIAGARLEEKLSLRAVSINSHDYPGIKADTDILLAAYADRMLYALKPARKAHIAEAKAIERQWPGLNENINELLTNPPQDPMLEEEALHSLKQRIMLVNERLEEASTTARIFQKQELHSQRRLSKAGLAATIAAAAVVLFLASVVLADTVSEQIEVDLESEVRELTQCDEFKARIELLSKRKPLDGETWELAHFCQTKQRRTHLAFEAIVRRGDEEIKLWGKRYTWSGIVKSFQRLLLPAYHSATWQALCAMHNHGIGGPVPITSGRCGRDNAFRRGWIFMCEHIGETRQLINDFFTAEFVLLPQEERRTLLIKLAEFIRGLHRAGIYRFSPRNFHASNLSGRMENARIYLFDLDKCIPLNENIHSPLRRRYIKNDLKGIIDKVQYHITPEELELFRLTLYKD